MAEERVQRRLAAILAADVVGYSSLMGRDEAGTRARFNAHLDELIEPAIEHRYGRIVKTLGDGLLVEFASVVDAVQCAVDIQRGLAARNADEPGDRRLDFRIGVNLGDVIVEDADIHGDGVNVAARLEGLADPGGICISRAARDQIRDKLDYGLEDMGEVEVKNIARAVRAFRVLPDGEAATSSIRSGSDNLRPALAAILGVVLIAGGGLWWWQPWDGRTAPPRPTGTGVSLTDKPSIAVLPFSNMSDDKAQEYFSAGITEDITTDLSRVVGLIVTPSSATRRYRGKDIDPRAVADRLGVRHILEGGVRRAGNRLRITAKLIDSVNGVQVWAERYDRDLKDIFATQDDIADKVVAELSKMLKDGSLNRVARSYTPSLEAYDLYIQGRAKRIPPTQTNLEAALQLFEKAIDIDRDFAGGYAGAAYVHILRYGNPSVHGASPSDDLEAALRLAEKAVTLDPTFGPAWGSLSEAYMRKRNYDDALRAAEKAMETAPNDSLMRATYGRLLGHIGRPEEGILQIKQAMRLSPDSLPMLYFLGANYRAAGQFDNAIDALTEHRKRLGGRVIPPPTAQLIAAYAQAGSLEKARAEVQALMKVEPRFGLAVAARTHYYRSGDEMARFLGALRQAGVPE